MIAADVQRFGSERQFMDLPDASVRGLGARIGEPG